MKLTEFLNYFDFDYEKDNDNYRLIDLQGAYLGGIRNDRFNSIEDIVERLTTYYHDYIYSDITDEMMVPGADVYEGDEYYPDILKWLKENNDYGPDNYYTKLVECIVNPELLEE